ncbi:MAG: PLD nuclease N-terminal domain-containing protein [Roseiflexus sp.]|nr:PLD nuclease N-terminal domain-containing protein [Roseiflexus sp.]MDW8148440.1 PLD nuclease N-terminal domain-containing protein [Roseiflexaceae bacterium]
MLILWLVLAVLAILRIRRQNLPEPQRVLWTLVVLAIPVLGALAFFFLSSSARYGKRENET